jgi:hypothetical protein
MAVTPEQRRFMQMQRLRANNPASRRRRRPWDARRPVLDMREHRWRRF